MTVAPSMNLNPQGIGLRPVSTSPQSGQCAFLGQLLVLDELVALVTPGH